MALTEGAIDRWHTKADAAWQGWKNVLGSAPPRRALALFLAVAQHETMCGDSSVATCNWGACQKRTLRPDEKAALAAAGLAPSFPKREFVEKARHALAAAIEAGTLPALDHEELFCDSTPKIDPTTGKSYSSWYWVMFWAFPDDVGGAGLLAKVLVKDRPSCAAVLARADALPGELADAMYRTHYYEGVHPKDAPGGPAANVADYAKALARWLPDIEEALSWWEEPKPAALTETQRHHAEALDRISRWQAPAGLDAIDALEGDTEPAPPPSASQREGVVPIE